MVFETPHTSIALRGYSSGGWIMESNGNHSQCLLDWLAINEEIIVIRSNARYEPLVNRLKNTAKKTL
ncbi:MAG: hypothetical protein II980_01205 [Clostridia bacterium]|nr:hypothetical protein [Clostridia bacterium]